jgi:ADP-ribose pyrophosphatase YjhB (NUDIX family)
MSAFAFCPACGGALDDPDADGGARCPRCDRSWYRDPAPTAGCALVEGDRALVTVRAREPFKGRFDVPGGFLHVGEHPIDGLKRELKEELGVEIDVTEEDFLAATPHPYGGADGDWVLSLGYRGRVVAGEPTPADDVAAIEWVTADELDSLDFAWPHDRELVRKALSHEPRPPARS